MDSDRQLWALTAHVCRVCYGRVLEAAAGDNWERGAHLYRCSNCGQEAIGRGAPTLCACGQRLKTGKDAGLRCEVNTDQSPEFPSEIVAGQVAGGA